LGIVILAYFAMTIFPRSGKVSIDANEAFQSTNNPAEPNQSMAAVTSGNSDAYAVSRREAIHITEDAPVHVENVEAITDAKMTDAAKNDILSAAYSCGTVKSIWKFPKSDGQAGVFKVDCGADGAYQITALNGREFVKPWTGVLLGATGD
jgi:hypothetical protein